MLDKKFGEMLISESWLVASTERWTNALALEPSSGRRDTDREVETGSASGFFILFSFLVWPPDTRANETMICHASIANENMTLRGTLEKERACKHSTKFIQLLRLPVTRQAACACTRGNQIAKVEETVSKRIKPGSTDSGMILQMRPSSGTGCSSLFVHTDPVNSTGKMK